jgi:alpha-ketoglutarate-dependent taurine dioxygenase
MTDLSERPSTSPTTPRGPAGGLTVHPLSGHTGAEIGGVDLSRPISDAEVDGIRQALQTWKVVFFRDQHIGHAEQIAFGRRFGELTWAHPHDETPPDGFPEIYTVDRHRFERRFGKDVLQRNRARRSGRFAGWHTDVTPAVNPPAGSILRADVLPPYGGDTTWTNLVAAYNGLSAPVKAFVDTLRAEHRYGVNYQPAAGSDRYSERLQAVPLVSIHPVVRVHPETGERALFVTPGFTDHIVDVTPLESRWILDHLFAEITRPEYQVRFRWAPGSVAFWDNRATAHLGPTDLDALDDAARENDEAPVERVLHRVTLIGDVPVGPDGRASELVEGEPFRSEKLTASSN